MKHFKHILVFFFLLIGLIGCEKYKLKQPTSLALSWKMVNNENQSNSVELTGGKLNSDEFSVEGTRVEGEDVKIDQSFIASVISFNTNQALGLNVDVPIGNYTEFKLKLGANSLDGYSFKLNGIYHGSDDIAVRIEWNTEQVLEFVNYNSFELEKDKNYSCILELDRQELLQDISSIQWQNATVTLENSIPTIVISKDFNSIIFSEINERVSSALHLSIE
jgi:hypothetical protein